MSQQWRDFIDSLSIPDAPCELESSAVYPLKNHDFLQISGPDSTRFLQGQLSCDVTQISLEHAGLGSHNTAQGRMRSSFRICQYAADTFLLRVHLSISEQAKGALAKYIVFSKAKISSDNSWAGIGLHGETAFKELGRLFSLVPDKDLQQHIENNTLLICTSVELKSYEIYTESASAIALWPQLAQNLPARSAAQHQLLENCLGLAFVEAGTAESFIPQMFNYQSTSAISFTKGCYTGQEIIARMKYLGKLKRHMHHYTADSDGTIAAGDPLFNSDSQQSIGNIISAVKTGNKSWDLLIVLTDAADTSGSFRLEKDAMEKITRIELPYKTED